jgi:hypothetical protein
MYQLERLSIPLVALGLAACQTNTTGKVGADKLGDTSHPAERGSPIDELKAACGSGTMTPTGTAAVHRQPYFQQVTQTSAMIGWVSVAPVTEMVSVTTADKGPVASFKGEPELAAVRSAGEKQMWAQLTDLAPDTIYCYALSDGSQILSEPTGFRTAPAADDPKPVRFMAFGDSGGGGSDQYALLAQMFDVPYHLIIHTGDIAYDNGTISQFEDNVFGVYAELFRNLPFFPAAGNHDYETLQGAPFRDVFALPGDSGEKWYSYDWGRVHFVALDTEADYATQVSWLDQDLAATQLPWKIVYFHRPPYSSGTHGSDVALRNLLGPVVEKHHVQLVLSGHDHDYERMIPQNGVNYVVTGGGGKGTRGVGSSSFTAFSDEVIHYVYVEVGVDELVLHAIDATGTEFDSLVATQQ